MRRAVLVLAMAVLGMPALAQDLPGSPALGHDMARRDCSGCHAVERDELPYETGGIPPFQAVARDPAVTETALRVFLRTTHPSMPNIMLTQDEIDNVVAYILSLKGS
jgi:mono/diheme cytochrome c family protein